MTRTKSLQYFFLIITLLGILSRADFLSRELQAVEPSAQQCSEASSVVCTQCGSSNFYSFNLGELKAFRGNLGDIESSLQGALQSGSLDFAESNGISCIYLSNPQPLENGASILSFIKDNFNLDLATRFTLPFVNLEQYQLSSLSFNFNPSTNQYSIINLKLRSDITYSLSKNGNFQDLQFEYDGKDNDGVLTGNL